MSLCYESEGDTGEGRCPNTAAYAARLDWTAGLMLLCVDHAASARALGDVVSIRSVPTEEQAP